MVGGAPWHRWTFEEADTGQDRRCCEIADSYAIQRTWTALNLAEGRVINGHKIGLMSRAAVSIAKAILSVFSIICKAIPRACSAMSKALADLFNDGF